MNWILNEISLKKHNIPQQPAITHCNIILYIMCLRHEYKQQNYLFNVTLLDFQSILTFSTQGQCMLLGISSTISYIDYKLGIVSTWKLRFSST